MGLDIYVSGLLLNLTVVKKGIVEFDQVNHKNLIDKNIIDKNLMY